MTRDTYLYRCLYLFLWHSLYGKIILKRLKALRMIHFKYKLRQSLSQCFKVKRLTSKKNAKKNTFGHPENQRAMSAPFFWTILNSLCKSKKQLHRVLQNVVKDATFGGTGHEEYEEIRKCKTTKKNIYIQNHQLKDVVAYSGLFHVFSMFWWFFDFEFGWRTYQAKPTLAIENSIQVCRVSSTTPPASLKQFHHW